MGPLAASVIYLGAAIPLVLAAAWSMYRYSALPLIEAFDADEMLLASVQRLATAAHLLIGLGLAVALTPSGRAVERGSVPAVLSSWAALLLLLGTVHLAVLGGFALTRRQQRRSHRVPPAPVLSPAPFMPPAPLMPAVPTSPVPVYAARPYGPPPADPWAPPFR